MVSCPTWSKNLGQILVCMSSFNVKKLFANWITESLIKNNSRNWCCNIVKNCFYLIQFISLDFIILKVFVFWTITEEKKRSCRVRIDYLATTKLIVIKTVYFLKKFYRFWYDLCAQFFSCTQIPKIFYYRF